MNAFTDLKNAALGWLDLISGRPDALARFNFSRAGIINALGFYLAMVLFSIGIDIAMYGAPGLLETLLGLAFNLLPLVILWSLTIVAGPVLTMQVPPVIVTGTYALAFTLLIGVPLALIAGPSLNTGLLGMLSYLLYRAARIAGGVSLGRAVVFAAVALIALVVMPMGLYMLAAPAGG